MPSQHLLLPGFDLGGEATAAGGPQGGTAMANPIFLDNEFLLDRAERCRSLAATFLDPILRDRMLEIAEGYEDLAKKYQALTPLKSIAVSDLKS
jgi:hypothetical protein